MPQKSSFIGPKGEENYTEHAQETKTQISK